MDLMAIHSSNLPGVKPGLRGLIKMMMIMNLTAVILLAACLQVSAKGFGQRISLSEKDAPLEKVFSEIKRQSGYTFAYTESILANSKKITIVVTDGTLDQVLELCFKEQPFTYVIIEKTVVIKPKEPTASAEQIVLNGFFPSLPIDIHGRITDPDGEPLVGATIKVLGSTAVAVTDGDGRFTLKQVDESASIEISYVGFVTQTSSVKNRANILLALKRNESPLDEVQVGAYSKTSKRFQTGNVTTIKRDDIERQPVDNPLLALYNVPGLFITQVNGMPGSGIRVRIQGQNSIAYGNTPFYVIDGTPFVSQMLSTTTGGLGNPLGQSEAGPSSGGSGNPLSFISVDDIESIEVLKDADATAIYGSRAANGAILITTKKGKIGKTKLDINVQNGWGQVTRQMDLMNTQQYLQMRKEALKNDNIVSPSIINTPTNTDYDVNGLWDTTRNSDWQKLLIGGTAQYTNVNATVSGGNTGIQYLIGSTFHRQTSVSPGAFQDQKGSVYFNLNSISNNQKFRLQMSASYLVDNNKLQYSDMTTMALQLAPDAPALFKTDGNLNWAPNPAGNSSWSNPLSYTYLTYQNKTTNLLGNANLSYHILPGLEIKSSFGYVKLQTNEFQGNPFTGVKPEVIPLIVRTAFYSNSTINSWSIEPQINYTCTISKGKLDALIGTTIQQNNSDGQDLSGSGYNSDGVLRDIHSASSVTVGGSISSVFRYNALFGRINYNYDNKYIINLTARRDGSSRFGANNQFNNFGAVGAAWIFSEENFFKKTLPFISYGKMKTSYGTTGSDQIGDYKFLSLYNPLTPTVPYQNSTSLVVNGIPNPYLQWEETQKLSIGLDLGFLKDRIIVNASYNQNKSSNQLLPYGLPIITGVNSFSSNFPAVVQNTTWEFSLNTINIQHKSFSWGSGFNLTIPQNKLIAFTNLSASTYANTLVIGQPVTGLIKTTHFVGVDPATGIYLVTDRFGNPTSSPNGSTDNSVLINVSPKFYGGFINSFSYKGFQLDFLFQFVKQVGGNSFFGFVNPGQKLINQPAFLISRWQKPGDISSFQRYNSNLGIRTTYLNATSSDAAFTDASYFRLKNLSVSYKLPEKWLTKNRIQNCRIYMQGQNLITLTKYLGLDPENQGTSLPPLRVVTFGLQFAL